MRPLPAVAATQWGAFRTDQALADGWTTHALRHAVAMHYLERMRIGVYGEPLRSEPGFEHDLAVLRRRAVAFALTHRRFPVTHSAASALHGLPLLTAPSLPCATFPRRFRGQARGVHLHRARLFPGDVVRLGSVLCSSPARTVIDLAREQGVDAGVVAGDAALRLRLTTWHQLAAALSWQEGWPGAARARDTLCALDGAAESPLESRSRLRLRRSDLPVPATQTVIRTTTGTFVARVDFYWDEAGVVGEADGLAKYGDPGVLRAEKVRQEHLEQLGLIVVRWGWSDLAAFDLVLDRVRTALVRGVRPDRAARLWSAELSPQARACTSRRTARTR